jgi:two-component system, OmpR family, KDP operon response regulator KdpE
MSGDRLRVLLVEDETLNRALVRAVLNRRADELPPLDLVEVDTLADARKALGENPADIILLDVRLPDGSGLDLARELRDGRDEADSPVVAILSASVLALERVAAQAAGADAFLAKPFVPTELTALIKRMAAMVQERHRAD